MCPELATGSYRADVINLIISRSRFIHSAFQSAFIPRFEEAVGWEREKKRERGREKERETVKRRGLKHTRAFQHHRSGHRAVHSDVGSNMQLDGFPSCLFYFYTQQRAHKPSSVLPLPHADLSLYLSLFLFLLFPIPPFSLLISRGPYRGLSTDRTRLYTRESARRARLVRGRQLGAGAEQHPSCWAKTAALPLPPSQPRTLRRSLYICRPRGHQHKLARHNT